MFAKRLEWGQNVHVVFEVNAEIVKKDDTRTFNDHLEVMRDIKTGRMTAFLMTDPASKKGVDACIHAARKSHEFNKRITIVLNNAYICDIVYQILGGENLGYYYDDLEPLDEFANRKICQLFTPYRKNEWVSSIPSGTLVGTWDNCFVHFYDMNDMYERSENWTFIYNNLLKYICMDNWANSVITIRHGYWCPKTKTWFFLGNTFDNILI